MVQSIVTKYLPATNTKCLRVKATASGGRSVTAFYDDELSEIDNHRLAAMSLCLKLGWYGKYVAGFTANGGYVFVDADDNGDGFAIAKKYK